MVHPSSTHLHPLQEQTILAEQSQEYKTTELANENVYAIMHHV